MSHAVTETVEIVRWGATAFERTVRVYADSPGVAYVTYALPPAGPATGAP